MRRSQFSESQILGILKEVESGFAILKVVRRYGMSKATFFTWRAKYGGASVAEVMCLKGLDSENSRLRRMFADLTIQNAAIQEVLSRKL